MLRESGFTGMPAAWGLVTWRPAGGEETLETVCALSDSRSVTIACARRDELTTILNRLGTLAGTPVIEGHGDLHVGQVLRAADGRFVVTDFDGNPVLRPHERMLPIPRRWMSPV